MFTVPANLLPVDPGTAASQQKLSGSSGEERDGSHSSSSTLCICRGAPEHSYSSAQSPFPGQVRTAEPPAHGSAGDTHPHLILSRAGGSAKGTQPSKARDYSRVP